MQTLSFEEIEIVSGGTMMSTFIDLGVGFLFDHIPDAVQYVGSLNQGGTPHGTDPLGNVY